MRDVAVQPTYLDVSVPAGAWFVYSVPPGHTVFLCGLEGDATLGQGQAHRLERGTLALYERSEGDVVVCAGASAVRFVLASGRQLGEPVAWRGPIVMNTQDELRVAFEEHAAGTFTKGAAE